MIPAIISTVAVLLMALIGVIFRLGLTLGTINTTLEGIAGDLHSLRKDQDATQTALSRHERTPHPPTWPASSTPRAAN